MKENFQAILITGASSGIGHALALHYAAPKRILFLMGRDLKRLSTLAQNCQKKGATVHTAALDVTDKNAMTDILQKWNHQQPIDLVIANAGISQKGIETRDCVEKVLATNINGVINTIYPFIPEMKEKKSGHIAIVSSLAGFRGMPTAVSYSASKNAVRALGDALRPELKAHNVFMTVICPGFIRTPLTDSNPFPMPFLMTAETAATRIAHAIAKRKKRYVFPWPMAFMTWLMASLPLCITDPIITRAAHKKRKEKH